MLTPLHLLLFLVLPRSSGGGAGGQAAKDALGNDVTQAEWLKTHKPGDHSLVQGLKVRFMAESPTAPALPSLSIDHACVQLNRRASAHHFSCSVPV